MVHIYIRGDEYNLIYNKNKYKNDIKKRKCIR